MNTKGVDLLFVLLIVVLLCIIRPNVHCIENNQQWINNSDQFDNTVVQHDVQPEIQNFISAPDAIVGFDANAINDTTSEIDYKNNQFYPYPFSVNDVAKNNVVAVTDKHNENSAIENVRRKPQFASGFQMLRRSVATMVEKIQYFIQSIWNYFTVGKFEWNDVFCDALVRLISKLLKSDVVISGFDSIESIGNKIKISLRCLNLS